MSTPAYIDTVTKTPAAKLTYGLDLGTLGWLDTGETLSTMVWTIAHADGSASPALTTTDDFLNDAATAGYVRLEAGTDDVDYTVKGHWTTTPSGLEDERTILVRVRKR